MMGTTCQELADRLPDWIAGRLSDGDSVLVKDHVSGCEDCSAQADLLAELFSARPEAPTGMGERIASAASVQVLPKAETETAGSRPAWVLSAAAVLVLAVGTTLLMRAPPSMDIAGALGEVSLEESQVWIADDGAVAEAPVLDDLSDEALATLIEELGA